eukprot:TRINITY_DN4766_c1_g1_i1.p1 TRINITY_DN4766_c1_g1~~TRINITY_DN4766_c1_g1_i1.p1  ORF type:complete len:535 (-),score=43.45 TRINITY_DN4766_c1_g1_i1:518-1948(-)
MSTSNGTLQDLPPGISDLSISEEDNKTTNAKQAEGLTEEEGGTVDPPDLSLKTPELREITEVKTEITGNNIYEAAQTFEQLGISEELLQGLYTKMQFQRPSQIQAKTLPMILQPPHQHLVAQAHSGSGKTTCFALSMLSRVDRDVMQAQALCICPTRELVVQNKEVILKMGEFTGIRVSSTADEDTGRGPVLEQIVVGTHGRLKNWYRRQFLSFDYIKLLVFDEADEMLQTEGFADDSVRVINAIKKASPNVQILLFSATFNEKVKDFVPMIIPNCNRVFVPQDEISLDIIRQYRVKCRDLRAKMSLLIDTILPLCDRVGQAIIFVRTREMAKRLHEELEKVGHKVTSIEGGMQHEDRDRVVREFREGVTKLLVATDVLARGFDVSQCTLVVNFDLPIERETKAPAYETYLHRIGRSGRFGRPGAAFNLLGSGYTDGDVMDSIEKYFSHEIPEVRYGDEEQFKQVLIEAGLMQPEE